MKVLVSGSLAYDRIMDFHGKFADHILPEKIHSLNVSFFVPEMKESFGGCAGNIAYTLSLFGEEPTILARSGNDCNEYTTWLKAHNINTDSIEPDASLRTSFATIITDEADNQISAFYPGAGSVPYGMDIPNGDFAIISPGNPVDMQKFPAVFRERKTPFIFDPGQQIPTLSADDLKNGIEGAYALITNDYELGMIIKKTGWNETELLNHTTMVVTTFGEKGSRIATKESLVEVPSAKPEAVVDPTGAGDAYRAGFLAGLSRNLPTETCAKLGALAACYTVEREGTQTHSFTKASFAARYKDNFNELITL